LTITFSPTIRADDDDAAVKFSRNGVPPLVSGVPPPEIAAPLPKVVATPPGDAVSS